MSEWFIEKLPRDHIHLSSPVERLEQIDGRWHVFARGESHEADALVIATEAFTMYMSIKIGDTKREEIVAGYLEAISDASAK